MKKDQNSKKSNLNKSNKLSKGFSVTLKILLAFVIFFGTVCIGLLAGVTVGCIITTEPLAEEDLYSNEYVTKLYDTDGNVMLQLTGDSATNSEWVDIENIPKNLQNAFIAIEDERFLTHNGVDIKRTASAVLGFVGGSDAHGGSTITQQVVKNITGDDSRSVPRKIREQWRALQLEQELEKDEIIELYLNIIYFANNSYGVQVAADTYFDKDVSELTLAECAFLAGIPNSPAKYNPATTNGRKNAFNRQITILDAMLDQNLITQEEYIEAIQTPLVFSLDEEDDETEKTDTSNVYSYFEDAVINSVRSDLMELGYTKTQANNLIYNSGIEIYTTQNTAIQEIVDEVYCNQDYFKMNIERDPEDCSQSAITVIDHSTGRIVAMYGGYGEKTQSLTYNRATDIKRQPGSSIKPILVYAPLIDQGILTAGTAMDEMPAYLDNQNPDRLWPSNWDNSYHGLINARYALMLSYNVPAATWFKNNIDTCLEYLKKSGIDRTDEAYVSTALGGLNQGVSPTDVAAAYNVIANGGVYYEPIVYTKVYDRDGNLLLDNSTSEGTIVYQDTTTSSIVTSMLESVASDSRSMANYVQLYSADGTFIPTAAKTGSTNDLKDYWLAGFTSYYTAVVWYGYDNSTPMNESVEGSAARVLWKAVMSRIHANLEVKDFPVNEDIVEVEICTSTGLRATSACKSDARAEHWVYNEVYKAGTEPSSYCNVHTQTYVCLVGKDQHGKYYLATDSCTNTQLITGTLRSSLPYDIGSFTEDMYPLDWEYELSHTYCPHCTGGGGGETDAEADTDNDIASNDTEINNSEENSDSENITGTDEETESDSDSGNQDTEDPVTENSEWSNQ